MRSPIRPAAVVVGVVLLAACGGSADPQADDATVTETSPEPSASPEEPSPEPTSEASPSPTSQEPTQDASEAPSEAESETEAEPSESTAASEPSEPDAPSELDAPDEPEETDAPEETAAPAPDPRCASEGQMLGEAFIAVTTPVEGATLGEDPVMTGCGSTFEGTFQYELVTSSGEVVAEGFDTMTCGNGCVGTFETTLRIAEAASGPATLTVFEEDAADGGRVNVVEVPVTLD